MNRQLVLVPQGAEFQAVRRGLGKAGQPNVENVELRALPMGMAAVRSWLGQWASLSPPPTSILVLGVCGALVPHYGVGQVVVYGKCGNAQGQWRTCAPMTAAFGGVEMENERSPQRSALASWPTVTALSSDRPLCAVSEKATWAAKTAAEVVDMEGFPLVDFFTDQGIPITIVRVVSDASDRPIPDLTPAIAPDGSLRPLPLLQAFLGQPLPAWHLIQGSLIALGILEKTVAQLFKNK